MDQVLPVPPFDFFGRITGQKISGFIVIHSLFKNNILRAYGTSLLGVASGLLTNLWLLREIETDLTKPLKAESSELLVIFTTMINRIKEKQTADSRQQK